MHKTTPVIIISGLESESDALDLTRALLLLQQQRRYRKPLWRNLEFRPFVLTGRQATEYIAATRPVVLLEGTTNLVTGDHQAARETFPTLNRAGGKQARRAQ